MSKETMVTIYNPFLDAYCQVPLSLAEKFLGEVEELSKRVDEVKGKKDIVKK
jgi:hypothetical protein